MSSRRSGDTRPGATRVKPRAPRVRATSGLVLLSAAAVFSVYAAGHSITQRPRDLLHDQLALLDAESARETPGAQVAATAAPFRPSGEFTPIGVVSTPTPDPEQEAPPAATAVAGASPGAAPAETYQDGTYVGKGSGGHGSVEVTLIIEGGRIVSAEITGCRTMYPCSKIRALPGRVIERQSAAVDWISGATDSSRGFRLAVLAALAKAKTA
jgi:uncharacterized protein with FMN-binding domain